MTRIFILVGSETGNSLEFAERASADLERCGHPNSIFPMDDFPIERLADSPACILFICSTAGDGEEPGNMRKFSRFLRRSDLPADLLSDIAWGVFGLGDSSYDKFNFASKRIYRRLSQLGGNPLISYRGEGDERDPQGGLELGWNRWWPNVRREILQACPAAGPTFGPLEPMPPKCRLVLSNRDLNAEPRNGGIPCKLIGSRRLTPEAHFQDTCLLTFELNGLGPNFKFEVGDVFCIKPCNPDAAVDTFLTLVPDLSGDELIFGIDEDCEDSLKVWTDVRFPISVKEFLRQYVDFHRIPTRSKICELLSLADPAAASYSSLHCEKLKELIDLEDEYLDYVWRPRRSLLELLGDFQPTIRLTPSRLLQVFPRIRDRQFSIANDPEPTAYGTWRVELCVAMLEEKLKRGIVRRGLCSHWFSSLNISSDYCLESRIAKGSLHLPPNPPKTIFLFAAGTGIAPIRFLLQRLRNSHSRIYLYYGCRSLESDYYFREEWNDPLQHQNLTVFAVGSRDQTPKMYLDAIIKQNNGPLLDVIVPSDVFLVAAGHSRLNKLVTEALNSVWMDRMIDGKPWTQWLKEHGRFQLETWS